MKTSLCFGVIKTFLLAMFFKNELLLLIVLLKL